MFIDAFSFFFFASLTQVKYLILSLFSTQRLLSRTKVEKAKSGPVIWTVESDILGAEVCRLENHNVTDDILR